MDLLDARLKECASDVVLHMNTGNVECISLLVSKVSKGV